MRPRRLTQRARVLEKECWQSDGSLPIKDEHFEPLAVPHKWMRLEVELPPLELDTSKSMEDLQSDIAVMRRR